MVNTIIENKDMELIFLLASKYNLTVTQLGKIIAKDTSGIIKTQVRFSEFEFDLISKNSSIMGITMTKFCAIACSKILENGLNNEQDFYVLKEDKENRNKRVSVILDNKEDIDRFKNFADNHGIKTSTLIRYCALQYVNN